MKLEKEHKIGLAIFALIILVILYRLGYIPNTENYYIDYFNRKLIILF